MKFSSYTKLLMTALTLSLLLNGLNSWINPPNVAAKEVAANLGKSPDTNCSSAIEYSNENSIRIADLKRLIGYIESTVNDIKMTVSGIDRKMNKLPSHQSSKSN